ncbi:phosphotransferase family protein [Streptomyces rubellomurinus]|uniref:Phosphotransferase n=1 Tax=Streptomyces sp. Y1 TaxID=3238634 RepID=A0AB39TV82_9ACTN|nr:phosphotransferase [Streptomyces rubellomurinus]
MDYPSGGFTPGIAARLRLADGGRVFIKGVPAEDRTAGMYRAEAAVGPHLPSGVAPALLWTVETGGWLVLGFEDVDGTTPEIAPGSAGLGAVLATVGELGGLLTPCPAGQTGPFSVLAGTLAGCWERLAEGGLDGWDQEHAPELVALDDPAALVRATEGDTLLHCDLRADNMLLSDGRVRVIDWSWFARGAAWVDAAFFLPQLMLAGHAAASAEHLLAEQVPAWREAPEDGVLAFAAAITGYWAWQQRTGPGGALGAYRGRAAAAGREWIAHRTGWNTPVPVTL